MAFARLVVTQLSASLFYVREVTSVRSIHRALMIALCRMWYMCLEGMPVNPKSWTAALHMRSVPGGCTTSRHESNQNRHVERNDAADDISIAEFPASNLFHSSFTRTLLKRSTQQAGIYLCIWQHRFAIKRRHAWFSIGLMWPCLLRFV